MANTLQFLDIVGLQSFKNLITQYIDSADAASIKGVGLSGNKLLFYKVEPIEGATAAYEVTLPEADLSDLQHLIKNATAGNLVSVNADGQVVDSGKKAADFDVAGAAAAVLGSSTDTATDKTVYGAFAAVEGVKTTVSSLSTGQTQVTQRIDAIEDSIGTVPEDTTLVQMISDAEYDDTAIKKDIQNNATAIAAEQARAKAAEGDLTTLGTTAKTDLVSAINEVRNSVSAGGTAAAITMDTSTTTAGYLKSYTIKQGDNTIGVIDIPKDMVVQSGSVEVDPEGKAAGTYIKLVLANVDEPLYINVGTLVDIYTAQASAAQVQLTINSNTREISAVIVAGSIGTTELADNAITTVKIADANVTKAKLANDVQVSLGKADTAVQSVDTGTANGTISVDGKDVAVKGLKGAAFAETTAFDAAGSAAAVLGTASDTATANTVYGAKAAATAAKNAADGAQADADELKALVGTIPEGYEATTITGYVEEVKTAIEAAGYDDTALKARVTAVEEDIAEINNETTGILAQAKSYANTQDATNLATAKAYTDTLANGQVTTNKNNIATNTSKIAENTTAITANTTAIDELRDDLDAIEAIPVSEITALFS